MRNVHLNSVRLCRIAGLLAVLLGAAPLWAAQADSSSQRSRIKDVATIEGIRDNQLVGYGLVVGLRGTGDSSQTVFPAQTLISALERMGITVPQTGSNSASNMQVKNMAGVFVVATLPPFSRPGFKLDVTISSAGDARSLEGGVLLMTPLFGPDDRIGRAHGQGGIGSGGAGFGFLQRASLRGGLEDGRFHAQRRAVAPADLKYAIGIDERVSRKGTTKGTRDAGSLEFAGSD